MLWVSFIVLPRPLIALRWYIDVNTSPVFNCTPINNITPFHMNNGDPSFDYDMNQNFTPLLSNGHSGISRTCVNQPHHTNINSDTSFEYIASIPRMYMYLYRRIKRTIRQYIKDRLSWTPRTPVVMSVTARHDSAISQEAPNLGLRWNQ